MAKDMTPDATKAPYQVLARKYRPQSFDDLIGHQTMVATLRNAFATGRIAHAYVLTGVRGVGKTTTARILARALNYVGPDSEDRGPVIEMPAEGRHCRAIAESRHPDVFEMDAASRTGVGDIRELIEGVRYAPVEARYKVYIIDEVHMLSTAAFNALLKTLEEPPPHVKFIFATTEIRKLPVTVLSRCQRFDLRRIDPETLSAHLAKIAAAEKTAIEPEALAMIARAAEGSVRDALSILDQAIVQGTGDAASLRAMLGLADRTQTWTLLDALFRGDCREALGLFRGAFDAGADPAQTMRDLLEATHLLTRVKAAGPEAAAQGPAGEADAERARDMAARLSMAALSRAWSLLMKGLSETREAPDAAAAAEMALIRLAYAADLPTPDEALRMLKGEGVARGAGPVAPSPTGGGARASFGGRLVSAQPAAEPAQAHPARSEPVASAPRRALRSLADVARLAGAERDAKLRVELECFVHEVSFAEGRIDMRLDPRAPADLPGRITSRLKQWTGRQWIVSLSQAEGAPTLRDARHAEALADPLVRRALEVFPDAELLSISEDDAYEEAPPLFDAPIEDDTTE
jgi:DNA polymerase-3 subunit gamma/tau